jgi:hypothetical protein
MEKTIRDWKGLSEIYESGKYKLAPITIIFDEDKLTGLTFETYKSSPKLSTTEENK